MDSDPDYNICGSVTLISASQHCFQHHFFFYYANATIYSMYSTVCLLIPYGNIPPFRYEVSLPLIIFHRMSYSTCMSYFHTGTVKLGIVVIGSKFRPSFP